MTSMTRKFRISPAMILSIVALFVALGGSAYAVGIGKNTVRSPQIVDGTVRTVDVRDNAVNAAKIAPDAVGNDELAENSVTSQQVLDETLTNQDLGAASVTSSEIADGTVSATDLGANSVGSSELQSSSVRAAELGTIIQVSQTEAIKANSNKTAVILCPEGTTVISGGGFGTLYSIHMSGSFRNGNGWRVDARNNSGTDGGITAYAYCLSGGSSN